MPLRPLLLASLALGLSAGCSKPPTSPSEQSNEPGTAAQAPRAAQPAPSEPGSGGTMNEAAPDTEPEEGTAAAPQGEPAVYTVRVSGVRCIAAPCPTHLATPVNNPEGDAIHIHELDLSALNLPEARVEALNRQLEASGAKMEATIGTRPNAGPAGAATVLHVKRVVDGQ